MISKHASSKKQTCGLTPITGLGNSCNGHCTVTASHRKLWRRAVNIVLYIWKAQRGQEALQTSKTSKICEFYPWVIKYFWGFSSTRTYKLIKIVIQSLTAADTDILRVSTAWCRPTWGQSAIPQSVLITVTRCTAYVNGQSSRRIAVTNNINNMCSKLSDGQKKTKPPCMMIYHTAHHKVLEINHSILKS